MAHQFVCPVWIGYLLLSPLRKLVQDPQKILSPYIEEGMTVLDIGCAMGFFSLPLARMVGQTGCVHCVDMQARMLKKLEKRAQKAGVLRRIETRSCSPNSLGLQDLKEAVDFALAFAVVHEVPDAAKFFTELHGALNAGGYVLVAEPAGHVPQKAFERMIALAAEQGFIVADRPHVNWSRIVLLKKG